MSLVGLHVFELILVEGSIILRDNYFVPVMNQCLGKDGGPKAMAYSIKST